jgi:hypothetical protein
MHQLHIAWLVLSSVSFLSSVLIARRDKEHAPVAWYLGALVAFDLFRFALSMMLPGPSPDPIVGGAVLLRHLSQALYLGIIFALPAMCFRLYAGSKLTGVWIAYAAAVALVVLSYPHLRGRGLMNFYSLLELGSGVAALGCYFCHCLERLTTSSVCGLVFICGNLASVFIPALTGTGTLEHWPIIIALHTAIGGVVLMLSLRRLAVSDPKYR